MKQGLKLFLTLGIIFIVIGIVTVSVTAIVGASRGDMDFFSYFEDIGYYRYTEVGSAEARSLSVNPDTRDIAIDLIDESLEIVRGGSEYRLDYFERFNNQYRYRNEDGRLVFSRRENPRGWFGFTWKWFGSRDVYDRVTLYVPDDVTLKRLVAEGISGNITVRGIDVSDICGVETVSGNIYVDDGDFSELKTETISGNIHIESCDVSKLKTETVSGNVDGRKLDVGGDIHAGTVSGDTKLELSRALSEYRIDMESVSGYMRINGEKRGRSFGSGTNRIYGNSVSGNLEITARD